MKSAEIEYIENIPDTFLYPGSKSDIR